MVSSSSEEEVKEVEWWLISGGSWVPVPHKTGFREYKGDSLMKHVLKLPAKNLTFEILKNHVTALGLSTERGLGRLTYLRPTRQLNPKRSNQPIDFANDFGFKHLINVVGKLPKPVTLYHTVVHE